MTIRTGRFTMVALITLAVTACDIEFVAIDDAPSVLTTVHSKQVDALEAEVSVEASRLPEPPLVLVHGEEVEPVQEEPGHWSYAAQVRVDSLDPIVRVRIDLPDPVLTEIPILARAGPPVRVPDGDLLLPLEIGVLPAGVVPDWTLFLADSTGADLVTIRSVDPPAAETLHVDGSLIPTAVIEARVRRYYAHAIQGDGYAFLSQAASTVRFAVPPVEP